MFREHLFSALKLLDRGDLAGPEMVGSWAGELGQTQMMPSEYFKYAVDYDGDGQRNLLRSPADVIGSTANYIKALGWKRGEPWLQEIRVPQNLPWEETGLDVKHPRSQWAKWGVTLCRRPAAAERQPAGLGRAADGPARAGVPRLRQFPGLSDLEQLAGLFADRRLLRDPHATARRRCRRAQPTFRR